MKERPSLLTIMTSVVITRATASKQIPKFIVDVLRNNVTDPEARSAEFIFKDTPEMEFNSTEFPYVILTEQSGEYTNLSLDGNKGVLGDFIYNITVYHDNPKERDEIADEIRMYLSSKTSADADGTSLIANQIKIKKITSQSSDTYIKYPKILRVKEIRLTVNYWGA